MGNPEFGNPIKKVIEVKGLLADEGTIVLSGKHARVLERACDVGACFPEAIGHRSFHFELMNFHKRLGPIVLPSSVTGPNDISRSGLLLG